MHGGWPWELATLAAALLAACLIGLPTGTTPWLLAAVLAGFLAWHLRNLWRLERWLRSGRQRNPPQGLGVWGLVLDHYWRLRVRAHKRKKRLAQVIKEFRKSTAAMPDGAIVLDEDQRIAWFNEAAVQLIGLRGKADLGQRVVNLIRHPAFLNYLESGEYEMPVDIPAPAAEGHYLALRLVPYGQAQTLLIIRDVTRIKRLEAIRRDFVANASHELRSPLTVLAGYLEAMGEDEQVRGNWSGPLREMHLQTRRMTSLINDLLELSRLETETGAAPDTHMVNIAAMAERIRREADALGEGVRDIRIDIAEPGGLLGVENELYSAFSNLVFNAVRYTGEGGRIDVRWRRDIAGHPCFEVTDTGIGIAAKHIPRITQRFYRIDKSRSRRNGGTGLGLAIVKHVLQRHGGELEIESEPGRGSTFRCVFPAERLAGDDAPVRAAGG